MVSILNYQVEITSAAAGVQSIVNPDRLGALQFQVMGEKYV